jgi:aspartokinase
VLWDRSAEHLAAVLDEIGPNTNLVITGFIATTAEGVATTLKRDGSDYRCVHVCVSDIHHYRCSISSTVSER